MKKIVCIIQARIGSTRLPGKVMKKIRGETILYYVVERVKQSKLIDQIIVATTINQQDDVIVKEAERLNVNSFRGSEEDVLSRYYHAAKKYNADIIVRITSDCPLIDPEMADIVIKKHVDNKADYTANVIKRTYPRGLDTETFNFDILEDSYQNADKDYQKEHVTEYITEHPEKFKLQNVEAIGKLKRPDIRITLDTKEDFELIEKIILNFNNINFNSEDVIDFLNENPKLLEINKDVKQKEV
jgi:spore coat polysaccharide biosynthesis protein SpsF